MADLIEQSTGDVVKLAAPRETAAPALPAPEILDLSVAKDEERRLRRLGYSAYVTFNLKGLGQVAVHPGVLKQINANLRGRTPLSTMSDDTMTVRYKVEKDDEPTVELSRAFGQSVAMSMGWGQSRVRSVEVAYHDHSDIWAIVDGALGEPEPNLEVLPD